MHTDAASCQISTHNDHPADLPPTMHMHMASETVPPSSNDVPSGVRRSTRATNGVVQKTRYIDEAYLTALDMSSSQDVY